MANTVPFGPTEARGILQRAWQHPRWFLEELLGCRPWEKQVTILEALRHQKEVAVKSCHGIGKDWIAARAVLWWLFVHQPALVVTTGPTDRQVVGILWKEINAAHTASRIPFGGRVLTQELQLGPHRWALGFTAGDKSPTDFQGWHSPNILVIVDEACGVSAEIYDAIDSLLSSSNARKLEIGNPTDPASTFARSFRTSGIHKISINAFESPNFTAFGITERDIEEHTWEAKITGPLPYPELTTPEWVAKRYERWGPRNPLYQSRVLAQFPVQGEDTLIPIAHIEAAQERTLAPSGRVMLGVDVARKGSNWSVIAQRQGPVLRIHRRWSKCDTMESTGYVRMAMQDLGAEGAVIDGVGLGGGVVDRLLELGTPGIFEFNGGIPAIDPERFANRRAECYWMIREAAENGELDLDPLDEDLAAQLSAIRWKPTSKGQVAIESKDDMASRGVASPDDADAASMTYHGATTAPAILSSGTRQAAAALRDQHRGRRRSVKQSVNRYY